MLLTKIISKGFSDILVDVFYSNIKIQAILCATLTLHAPFKLPFLGRELEDAVSKACVTRCRDRLFQGLEYMCFPNNFSFQLKIAGSPCDWQLILLLSCAFVADSSFMSECAFS